MRFKTGPRRESLQERFEEKVFREPNSGCWIWEGATMRNGYGVFYTNFQTEDCVRLSLAHRVSYQIYRGSIPLGLDIDHLCRCRWCVNPRHLEPVTRQVNIRRGVSLAAGNARKTHCKRGHELVGQNLMMQGNTRQCRKCKCARNLSRYHLRKGNALTAKC